MKKVLALISLVAIMFTLVACGKFTCDMCGQEKSGKKHTEEFLGQKITYCDDCKKGLEELGGLF